MSLDYAKEKLWQAVPSLATGDESIQQRLAGAAMFLIRLEPNRPESLRQEFDAVRHKLTKEKAEGDEGTTAATTRQLTPEQGSQIAGRIQQIYTELHDGI